MHNYVLLRAGGRLLAFIVMINYVENADSLKIRKRVWSA